jgi:hypothetical protein
VRNDNAGPIEKQNSYHPKVLFKAVDKNINMAEFKMAGNLIRTQSLRSEMITLGRSKNKSRTAQRYQSKF